MLQDRIAEKITIETGAFLCRFFPLEILENFAMKLLVIGSGGREHALAWRLSQGAGVEKVFVAPVRH